MKWIIAEKITDPTVVVFNDDGDEVSYEYWSRREEEFSTKAEAVTWAARDPARYEVRGVIDGYATPQQLGITDSVSLAVLRDAAGHDVLDEVNTEHIAAKEALVERGLLLPSEGLRFVLSDTGKKVMGVN